MSSVLGYTIYVHIYAYVAVIYHLLANLVFAVSHDLRHSFNLK